GSQGVRRRQRAQGLHQQPGRHPQRRLRVVLPGRRAHPGGGRGPARHPPAQGLVLPAYRQGHRQPPAACPRRRGPGRRNRGPVAPVEHAGQRWRGAVLMAVRVLVVDDSAVVRQVLSELLAREPGIEVVGTAADPFLAREKIKRLNPDVITLDVEMPRMGGLALLENLVRLRPVAVVMVSSVAGRGGDGTLEALALGAVDFVTKPRLGVAQGLEAYADEIVAKVKGAARAKVQALMRPAQRLEPAAPRASMP